MKRIVILSLLAFFHSAYALPWILKNMEASYVVKYDGIPIGTSVHALKINKNTYNLCINNQTTVPFIKGFVKECSTGVFTSNTIQPLIYDYFYKQGKDEQKIHINFNWKTHIAEINANQTHWHLSFPNTIQDKISYQLLLRQGLANHQKSFGFSIADGGKIKNYQFKVIKSDVLATPWKKVNTIKLNRLPIPNKEDVSIWFMPDYDYIVAKVQQDKHIIDTGTAEITHVQS